MNRPPNSARVPYRGAVAREGAMLVPHSMAFPSAMMSLRVLMGAPHDTHEIAAHGTRWRADHDYNLYMALSGEGFLFLFDMAEYFRFALPDGAGPIADCFRMAGIPVRVYANAEVPGLDGGWPSDGALKALVVENLANGYPALLLGRAGSDRVLLAVGYEDGGDTLIAWTFTPGADMPNKSFAMEDCQYIQNWTPGTDAAALVAGEIASPPMEKRRVLLGRALARGARFLRAPACHPYGEPVNYYANWIDRLRDAAFWASAREGMPYIYPEIWDLAERRFCMAAFLEQVGEMLGTDALDPGIEASAAIHGNMWRIHGLLDGGQGQGSLKRPAVRAEIAGIVEECRGLDLRIADAMDAAMRAT